MPADLPVTGKTEPSKRRILLEIGDTEQWWTYESENPAGYVDSQGTAYQSVTYTILLPDETERVLLADEVLGYVLATAEQYGDEGLAKIAYRAGIQPPNG